ncbi:MAG: hypothetical protein ACK4K7_09075 [Allosphingosinicella sp.]|uniref:hypothetical protein n=1 Tax=Allosphingosinicella sp. TaxID=2823234 RepID=UPI0039374371
MIKALLSVTLLASGATAAQAVRTGSLDAAAEQEAGAVYAAARCIVRSDRAAAARMLNALPIGGDAADPAVLRIAAQTGCASPALLAERTMLIRGGLAQALFAADFVQFGLEPRNRNALVDLGLPVESDPPGDANSQLYRWSDCVVRNDSVNVERLMRSPAGSRQERQVIEAMRPYLTACADPDARLVVARSELRSLFAQSAYNAMYRYWTGGLRHAANHDGSTYAAAGDANAADMVTCRVYHTPMSRVRSRATQVKFCMTKANWHTAEWRASEWLRDATSNRM